MNNNTTQSNRFERYIIDALLLMIERFPARNAFCINEVFYTYKQFGECISKIRCELKKLRRDEIYIGLVANDDIETYASIFALWLEGKAYVPLHPNHPLERAEIVIKDVAIETILDSNDVAMFSDHNVINTNHLVFEDEFLVNDVAVAEDCIAYILFTSGSTGTPKGVTISRKNLGAFMESFWDSGVEINEEDRCLQCYDLTFDASVQCYLTPLTKGACMYTIPHDQIRYSYVYGLFTDHQLTNVSVVQSMLRYLRPYFDEIHLPKLKYCLMIGEASPGDLIREWKNCVPNADIYNFYGPTEATVYCSSYKVDTANIKTLYGMLSVGKPLKNVKLVIVDDDGNIVLKGEKGELCIAGDHVSPGYWNNPEKNAKAFFEKKIDGVMERFYRTGDLCYKDDEDDFMLYGRLDSQAKINGYRVELGEIEFHAREYLKGNNAAVMIFTNNIGNAELAIFIEGEKIDTQSLVDHIKTKVPPYMVPTKIVVERKFPLNSNGKVDKIKLREKIAG